MSACRVVGFFVGFGRKIGMSVCRAVGFFVDLRRDSLCWSGCLSVGLSGLLSGLVGGSVCLSVGLLDFSSISDEIPYVVCLSGCRVWSGDRSICLSRCRSFPRLPTRFLIPDCRGCWAVALSGCRAVRFRVGFSRKSGI